jgi:hypothetical protein
MSVIFEYIPSSGLLEKLKQLLSAEVGLKSYSNFSMMPRINSLYFIIYLFIILKLTSYMWSACTATHRYDCKTQESA